MNTPFTLFPAIDLLDGQSVRLKQGKRDSAHQVHVSPLDQLKSYEDYGATHVHIVNLNAAFGDSKKDVGHQKSLKMIRSLAQKCRLKFQLGGGIRSQEDAEIMIDLGAWRLVIGTWAAQNEQECLKWAEHYGDKFVLGLDTIGGQLAVGGWNHTHDMSIVDFAKQYRKQGVKTALFTVVERDGMLTGFSLADREHMKTIALSTGMELLASGGVRDLNDVENLSQVQGVSGVVLGKAIHAKTLDLTKAFSFKDLKF